ncbi:MAG: TIGR02301 family protein [Pseudomonadota bacterium]
MYQQVPHRPLILAFCMIALTVLPALPAHGQSSVRSQDYFRDLTALAEVLGKAHAIRKLCTDPNPDNIWRNYMLRLLEMEAPYEGGLRQSLFNGFNAGYLVSIDAHPTCDSRARSAERGYAAEGRDLSARLVQSTIPRAARRR